MIDYALLEVDPEAAITEYRIALFNPRQPRDKKGMWTSGKMGGAIGDTPEGRRANAARTKLDAAMGKGCVGGDPTRATYEQRGKAKAAVTSSLEKRMNAQGHAGMVEDACAKANTELRFEGHDPGVDRPSKVFAQGTLNAWAGTSGDTDKLAVAQQMALANMHGLDASTMEHLGKGKKWDRDADPEFQKHFNESARALYERHKLAFDSYAQAEYAATQEYLQKNGIEYVTVYRGVGASAGNEGLHTIKMQPGSSFATSLRVAMDFAEDANYDDARVIILRVHRSDILSTARTGRGCLNESEVIVRGGLHTGLVSKKPAKGSVPLGSGYFNERDHWRGNIEHALGLRTIMPRKGKAPKLPSEKPHKTDEQKFHDTMAAYNKKKAAAKVKKMKQLGELHGLAMKAGVKKNKLKVPKLTPNTPEYAAYYNALKKAKG